MELTDRQRQQVDAIRSLVTQTDQASIRQGVELAAALGDQAVFSALLAGVKAPASTAKKRARHRGYPTLTRGEIFDEPNVELAWLDLAVAHLLAVSDHPLRSEVASIALGARTSPSSKSAPPLWLEGLERLTSLTHLDLVLSSADKGIDLGCLRRMPNLTHIRLRGPVVPGPLPSLEHLEVLDGVHVDFEPGAGFPKLRSIRGRVYTQEPLSPAMMPSLIDIEARSHLRLEGFEALDKLWCHQGEVAVSGCRRIGHLRLIGCTFEAPDLRHVGTLVGAGPGIDVSRLETLEAVQFNRTSKFSGGVFPAGTQLLHPRVVFWGPGLNDLGNVGELPGLEVLAMPRVKAPLSLETLRHATSLRELDIRNSPGITDLSPLVGLPNLEVVVLRKSDQVPIPPALADKIKRT